MKWQDYVKLSQDEKEEYKFRFMNDHKVINIGLHDIMVLCFVVVILIVASSFFLVLLKEYPEYLEHFKTMFILLGKWVNLWFIIMIIGLLINNGIYIYHWIVERRWVKEHTKC